MTDTKEKTIHVAFTMYTDEAQREAIEMGYGQPEQKQWWVSDDGQRWLPVNRPPIADTTVKEISALFAPIDDGQGRTMTRLTWDRRYVQWAVEGQMRALYSGGAFMPASWYATSEDVETVEV